MKKEPLCDFCKKRLNNGETTCIDQSGMYHFSCVVGILVYDEKKDKWVNKTKN